MLRVEVETKKKKNNIACKIIGKSNMSEALAAIKAIRDYIARNEEGIMDIKMINKTIAEILEKEEKE